MILRLEAQAMILRLEAKAIILRHQAIDPPPWLRAPSRHMMKGNFFLCSLYIEEDSPGGVPEGFPGARDLLARPPVGPPPPPETPTT